MPQFEYDLTIYPPGTFSDLVYICTEDGRCDAEKMPHDQGRKLVEMLNRHGAEGWELVDVLINRAGVLAFWKRPLTS
ncbi:MAG: hypothetical protein P8Y63_11440 [Deltaproteobacteria bacterium]|jgi:hypothetical protein